MKSHLLTLAALVVAMTSVATAQDLTTVTVTDQFDSGSRSDQATEPAAYTAPTYPGITGTINYFNTFQDETPISGETPIVDMTIPFALGANDAAGTLPAGASNSADAFSTSPTFAVALGDGGGGQNLQFGTAGGANYYVRTAVWVDATTPAAWIAGDRERYYVSVRTQDSKTIGRNTDALGGYAISYESDSKTFNAVEWNPAATAGGLATAAVNARDAASWTVYATSAPVATSGWHILEVSAFNNQITYKLNGTTMITITDTTWTAGYASLSYREVIATNLNERQSRFDYVTAGPSTAPPVPTAADTAWSLYQ